MGYNPHQKKIKRAVDDRVGIIGGSSYGACQGLSTYKSPHQVALQFLGKEATEEITPDKAEALEMGHQLEDFIAKQGERLFGVKMKRSNFAYVHNDYDWLICHPDRVIVGKVDGKVIGVEIKSSTAWDDRWGAPDTDQVPFDYLAQCHLYMQCGVCDEVWLLRFSNNRVTRYIITADEVLEDRLLAGAVRFVENCRQGILPAIDDYEEAKKVYLSRKCEGDVLGTEEMLETARKLKEVSKAKNEAEKEANALKAKLLPLMHGKKTLIDNHGDKVITLSYVSKMTLDAKKVEAEYPDIYQKCLKDSGYNMFR